ncbi:MAG: hypothetical protein NTU62_03720 [Spirochaetes bacterium]|nr:hypothetical protein [Spirochaetota bacterium]
MKHPTLAACAALLMTAAVGLPAQSLDWGGSLQVDAGLPAGEDFTFPSGSYGPLGLSLDLHGEAQPAEILRLYGEILVSADGLPGSLADFADLSSYAALHPAEARLVEAYVDLYDVLLPRLDIRVGRQRIAWGPAERVGVVDLVDPNNLEDPWRYGERTASDALKVTWRVATLKVEAVYLPTFKPALLPADPSSLMPGPAVDLAPLVLHGVTTALVAPAGTVAAQATLASRISLSLGGLDIAVSYAYGRQHLPAVTGITGTFIPPGVPPDVDLAVTLEHPRQHVLGFDASGELWGIGLWAEAAAFFPVYTVVTDMQAIGGALTMEEAEPYLKAVVGLEYTFPGSVYLNLQYAHGFFHESTPGGLNDYLMLGVQWDVPGGFLTVGPIGAALEVDDFAHVAGTWALVLNPEIALHPMDNAELVVGARWIAGNDATTFGSQKEGNAVYARATFSF